jgi:DNA polymerase-3 subunit beta
MKINIPYTALQAISLFAAKKDTRYYLNGVLVETTESETRLVASNGHVLGLWREEQEHEVPESLILPNEAITSVLKAARTKKQKTGIITLNFDGGKVSLSFQDVLLSVDPIDGKFPDYRRLFNEMGALSGEPAQFDPRYLALFAQADAIFGGVSLTENRTALHYNGESKALVECQHSEGRFVGIIMPKRIPLGDPKTLLSGI